MSFEPTMFGDLGLAVFRIILGGVFVTHAIPKVKNFEDTQEFFADVGLPSHPSLVYLALVIEIGMGTLLAIGLYTQFAALILTVFMFIATYKAIVEMDKDFFGGYEIDLILLGASFMYYLHGAGKYAVDAVL